MFNGRTDIEAETPILWPVIQATDDKQGGSNRSHETCQVLDKF